MTRQRLHTALASSVCIRAGPVLPIGKNNSGSSARQAARADQSMTLTSGPPRATSGRSKRVAAAAARLIDPVVRPVLAEKCSLVLYILIFTAVSYTHLRAHETGRNLVCRLLL